MLTQLSTIKQRLAIAELDTQYDSLLASAIRAVSERFDRECRRTLPRTENFAQEFEPDQTEILAVCYPIETVNGFEFKTSEAEGWLEQTGIEFLLRRACVISLAQPLSLPALAGNAVARVLYTGGYVLPGSAPGPGQRALPDDLEQAAVEQVAFWFQNRDHVGADLQWPKGGTYQRYADIDLIPAVRSVLDRYRRM